MAPATVTELARRMSLAGTACLLSASDTAARRAPLAAVLDDLDALDAAGVRRVVTQLAVTPAAVAWLVLDGDRADTWAAVVAALEEIHHTPDDTEQ